MLVLYGSSTAPTVVHMIGLIVRLGTTLASHIQHIPMGMIYSFP